MRILVMLHPTNRHGTKMEYTRLRKFLVSDGCTLLNQELYMLVTTSRKSAETYLNRLKEYDPGSGVVRVLRPTEKQYSKMWYLTGDMDCQKKSLGVTGILCCEKQAEMAFASHMDDYMMGKRH